MNKTQALNFFRYEVESLLKKIDTSFVVNFDYENFDVEADLVDFRLYIDISQMAESAQKDVKDGVISFIKDAEQTYGEVPKYILANNFSKLREYFSESDGEKAVAEFENKIIEASSVLYTYVLALNCLKS